MTQYLAFDIGGTNLKYALMDKTGVICTPGHAFGSLGEGYVRFALVLPVDVIEEMIDVVDKSGILK